MSSKKDVIIIGAGVIGCSIAYHLAKKGVTSQIIDRESIGARASGKAWAVIPYPPAFFLAESMPDTSGAGPDEHTKQFYAMPEGQSIADWIELHRSGYYRFSDLSMEIKERANIDIEYGEGTNIHLFTTQTLENISQQNILSLFNNSGVYECDWIDVADLRKTFPGINPIFEGGISIPEFQVEPYKLTLGLAQAAENMGAEIKSGDVVGFRTSGEKITSVKLDSGTEIEADTFVIAMGPWSGQGASWVGKKIPMGIFMTECLRVEVPEAFPLKTLSHEHCSIIPLVNGNVILAGSNRITRHEKDDFDNSLSQEVRSRTMKDAFKMLPELEEAGLIEHRGDVLACSPEMPYNKPVMGRLPGLENGYVATRFGGLGICLSPSAGAIMADLIANGEAPVWARCMMQSLNPVFA